MLWPSLRTYTLPAVHRERDVAEDSTSSLCVLHSEALYVHLAMVGPAVPGVRVVDDEVGPSFTTRFDRQWLF